MASRERKQDSAFPAAPNQAIQARSSLEFVPQTFLAQLDEGERDGLQGIGVRRSFPRGAVLMFQDEPDERVMLSLAGRVKVARVDQDGHELLLSIRDPGDLLGELAFIDGQARTATVTALDAVDALVIPGARFRQHLETTPRIAVVLLRLVACRFREETIERSQFAASDTLGRLAARIVELADRYGDSGPDGVTVAMPLTQEELSAWTGASRAGVAQAMHELRELGWLRQQRRILIATDMAALRARAA